MSKKIYVITGIAHTGVRIKPIFVDKKPASHTGHLQSGTIWTWCRIRLKRKLVKRFTNNELVLLP